MKTWTAVYVRVSTAEQRVDSQELELRRYCGQRGWKDVKFYTDRISGASCSRPELTTRTNSQHESKEREEQ